MDGWHRLGSDDDFRIRQVLLVRARFCCCARWAWFSKFKNIYITSYSIFTHNIPFINIGGCRNGWLSQQLS